MINEKNTKIFIYIALILLVLALDRISKILILNILVKILDLLLLLNLNMFQYIILEKLAEVSVDTGSVF